MKTDTAPLTYEELLLFATRYALENPEASTKEIADAVYQKMTEGNRPEVKNIHPPHRSIQ